MVTTTRVPHTRSASTPQHRTAAVLARRYTRIHGLACHDDIFIIEVCVSTFDTSVFMRWEEQKERARQRESARHTRIERARARQRDRETERHIERKREKERKREGEDLGETGEPVTRGGLARAEVHLFHVQGSTTWLEGEIAGKKLEGERAG